MALRASPKALPKRTKSNDSAYRTEIEPLDKDKPFSDIALPITDQHLVLSTSNSCPEAHRLYCGDALEVLATCPDQSFDACITDPPYNISRKKKGLAWAFSSHVTMNSEWDQFSPDEYGQFTIHWMKEIMRVTKKNGNIFIFGSYHNIYLIGALAQWLNLRFVNSIIWAKPNAQPNITCRMFTESTEQIVWLCNNSPEKAKNWTFNYHQMKELNQGKQMRNFWEIPVTPLRERRLSQHPSQKPLRIMERIVLAGTNPCDMVLDCFSGSGSTLLACDRLERRWVGIEKNADFCQMSYARLMDDRQKRRAPNQLPS